VPIEVQQHQLRQGSMTIYRNGNHQYWSDEHPALGRVPGVTSLVKHVDEDGFGAGMGYVKKHARLNDGDLDAADQHSKQSMIAGNKIHDEIDRYISHGEIAESPEFLAWYHEIGEATRFLASERFIIDPFYRFGGTVDALADERGAVVVMDWKTVDPESWEKHGSKFRKAKDTAQIGAYTWALREMDSIWWPRRARIAYIIRGDNSACHVEDVNIELGIELFKSSQRIHALRKEIR
jgi:hypothetical protein